MTTTVYFMRHGDAGDKRFWEGDDADRPLSELGVERTTAAAKHFARTRFRPTKILTSPLVRATQTAEIVAEMLGDEDLVEVDSRLAPDFDVRVLRRILKENPEQTKLLLVGHEPSFSAVIDEVMGGGSIVLKKGGVARVDIEHLNPPCGRLIWLDAPSLFISPEEPTTDAPPPG